VARFYDTPEGRSLARKGIAFTAVLGPVLQAEFVAWAQTVQADAPAGEAAGARLNK
jgi:hypothetical protein